MPDHPTPESTRREGVPAAPVVLADGREWSFARPALRLAPRVVPGVDGSGLAAERISVEAGNGYPPEVEGLIGGLRAACEGGAARAQYDAFFSLAVSLLKRAHEVSLPAACDLLSLPEAELPRLVREIMAIVSPAGRQPGDSQGVDETCRMTT
jgi:hypothetical protein